MNSELRPGILALVIGYRVCPDNVGKCVELVKFVPQGVTETLNGYYFTPSAGDGWIVKGETVLSFNSALGYARDLGGYAVILAKHLMPIPPEEIQESTKEERKLPCPAD